MRPTMEYETKYIDENKWRVELEALTQEYERMLAFIEQELKTAPEGSLVIYHSVFARVSCPKPAPVDCP